MSYNIRDHVPNFSGEGLASIQEYPTWRTAIVRAIAHLRECRRSDTEIFLELKRSLTSNARKMADALEVNDDSLVEVLRLFDECYLDVDLLVDNLIEELINLPPLTSKMEAGEGRRFYASLTSIRSRFRGLDLDDADLATAFFQNYVKKKVPRKVADTWSKKKIQYRATQGQGPKKFVSPPLDVLYDTILTEIKASLNRPQQTPHSQQQQQQQGTKEKNPKKVKGLTYSTVQVSAKTVPCRLCDNSSDHKLQNCPRVKAMTVKERWAALEEEEDLCWLSGASD